MRRIQLSLFRNPVGSSKSQLETIFQGIADGVVVQDADGRLIYGNQAAADAIGYPSVQALLEAPPGEPLGRFDIMDENGQPFPLDQLPGQLALQGARAPETLLRIRSRATGEERWSLVTATPIFDDQGQVQFAISVFHDVTELRRAEEARFHLAAIVDSSADAIIGKTLGGTITSWNPGAERMYGYTAAEAVGRSISMLIPPDRPDELPGIMARLALGERIDHFETVRVAKDGRPIDVSVSISPIRGGAGRIIGAATIARDVTERKRLEEGQRFMVESSAALADSLDYEATLATVASLAVPKLADWCAVDVVAEDGKPHRLAVAHVDPAKVKWAQEIAQRYPTNPNSPRGVPNVLRTGRSELYAEVPDALLVAAAVDVEHLELLRAVGFRSVMIVPLAARGRVLGAISFVTAESGRQYSRADLALAEQLASQAAFAIDNARLLQESQQAVRVRDSVLGTVSHDLKNPIAAIKGYAQLLRRRVERLDVPEREKILEGLNEINSMSTRMTRQLAELVDVTRLELGQSIELDLQPTDLVALARETVEALQETSDRHQIRFEATVPELVGDWDPTRLERVLGNLVANAIKYSPSGGNVFVSIAQEDDAAGGWAVASVRDQGVGIPAADLPHIFQPFHRAGNVADQIEGTGIGLASAHQIVERHGGTIAVASEEGKGSIFTVRLPLLATSEGDSSDSQSP